MHGSHRVVISKRNSLGVALMEHAVVTFDIEFGKI